VVETARLEGIRADASMQFYVDARHPDLGASNVEVLLLRGAQGADPARLLPEARRAVAEADPLIRYVEVTAARDQLEDEMRSWRLGALLFSTFGVLALVLAAAGLHAVISFDVSQQLRELGLRAALGASSKRLLGTVMQRAAVVTAVGLAIGLTASVALAPRLTDLVFEISPRDPASLALVGLLLMSIATLSAVAPALRAARVDPLQLLRLE
jgi:ABC-type antimicrobial peptide transport system permease subunit